MRNQPRRAACDVTHLPEIQQPVVNCDDTRVQVWHGMTTPAVSCGRHATASNNGGPIQAVFDGHRAREAAAA